MVERCDIVIIGGGIAGAGAGYALAREGKRVVLLERESQPGYHTTGRSAALYAETYGNAPIRALTVASRDFLHNPPPGFSDVPILTPRGAMHVGGMEKAATLDADFEEMRKLVPTLRRLTAQETVDIMPVLKPEAAAGGAIFEPEAKDIEVHALHRGFLRGMTAAGGRIVTDAEVIGVARVNGDWQVESSNGSFAAPVLINAAGAWADIIASIAGVPPIGLQPKRRTAVTFDPPNGVSIHDWPMVIEADESFYFKPDAGRILLSPCDETDSEACDAQPDEMDIAIAVDRLETATTLQVRRLAAKWAGLRSFVADRTIVCGFDPAAPGFFWLAAQGGYGIQTSAAMSRVAGALALGRGLPNDIVDLGLTERDLSPARLR
ncbi:FAD-dependent oxidoreductase [uncultured Ferrovibrio sp.]|jgi:D-arginine dehydrogenase|uniref:NAD(P)/FAD-dependent oxidoreductase n=1 Tax=uncultured Ferrovibrio sp. TaxID=1576913 RepID=UPI002604E1BB|nr:FAD-dependent oxidoreductase [uncultured Ferrovibrio sp.]